MAVVNWLMSQVTLKEVLCMSVGPGVILENTAHMLSRSVKKSA